jgi:hypothetical protein
MDKKIIKYKLKKNKLEEKIIDMLNLKKEYYENDIINSNDNETITEGVENFFQKLKSNQEEQSVMVIVIFGSYSVGKTTFISHLENYIKIVAKNLTKKKDYVDLVQKLNISSDNMYFLKNCNLFSKITIIECDTTIVNKINLLIYDLNIINLNIININIVPKNPSTLKNKIANKIIADIKNKSSWFIEFIKNNNVICDEEINNIIDGINLLKIKNGILLDDDFIFLDKSINLYYQHIINLSSSYNINLPLNTKKYYL